MSRIATKWIPALAIAALLLPHVVVAQYATGGAQGRGPRFLLALAGRSEPVRVDVGTVPALRRNLSLHLESATLAAALAEISRQADLNLVYSDDVVAIVARSEARITVRAEEITVAAALTHALLDARVDVVITANGVVTIVAQPPLEPLPAVGSIAGVVTRAGSGEPVTSANVLLEGTSQGAITDAAGRFRIDGVPAGRHTVKVVALGYQDASQEVEVEDGATVALDFALEVSALPLDEIVVTGSGVQTKVKEIPSPITVVTAADIEKKQVTSLADVLRAEVPGLVIFRGGQASVGTQAGVGMSQEIKLRGETTLSSFAAGQTVGGVKIYIDGVQVANPSYVANMDPNIVERVEVVRGPQAATLYGSGATNGVIQIFTKKGRNTGLNRPAVDGKLSVGYIESGLAPEGVTPLVYDLLLNISGGDDTYSYNVSGTYLREGEWVTEFTSVDKTLFGGLRIVQGPFAIEGSMRYGTREAQGYLQSYRRELQLESYTHSGQTYMAKQNTQSLKLTYQPTDRWSNELAIGKDWTEQSHWNRHSYTSATTGRPTGYNWAADVYERINFRYTTTLQFDFFDDLNADLFAGAELWRNYNHNGSIRGSANGYGQNSGTFGINSGVPFPGLTYGTSESRGEAEAKLFQTTGYYAQGKIGFKDAFFLTGGLRVEDLRSVGAEDLYYAPRIGAAYHHALELPELGRVDVKLRSQWGRSVQAPSPMLLNGSVGAVFIYIPNPGAKPETQTGWDHGVELYFGDRASFEVTYYDQTADNLFMQTSRPDLVPVYAEQSPGICCVWEFLNLGSLDNYGWEFSGSLNLGPLQVSGNYTINHSVVKAASDAFLAAQYYLAEENQMVGIPTRMAAFDVTMNVLRGSISFAADYTGPYREHDDVRALADGRSHGSVIGVYANYLQMLDPLWHMSMRANQRLNERLSAFLAIDNLNNERFLNSSNAVDTRGRTTSLGVRFNY